MDEMWLKYLGDRAVTRGVAAARGYVQVHSGKPGDGNMAATYGFRPSTGGLLMPLHPLIGEQTYQVRFPPGSEPIAKGGKRRRFDTPSGQPNHLATSPVTRDKLDAGKESIVITEGVTRVDALAGYGVPALALMGAFNWRGRNAKGGWTALADWESVSIKGNRFLLAFDGDVENNKMVSAAARRLSEFLYRRDADQVLILNLPGAQGLDDWIASNPQDDGVVLVRKLLEYAYKEVKAKPRDTEPLPAGRLFAIDDASAWSLSPQGDAHRLLLYRPETLCVVQPDTPGGSWGLLTESKGGRWTRDGVNKLILESALSWQSEVLRKETAGDFERGETIRATRHAVDSAKPRGMAETLASIPGVYGLLSDRGKLPPVLSSCYDNQVDADLTTLGTPDGVLSLDTGDLLPATEARTRFVTRSIPDSYKPGARHPLVDGLLSHLDDQQREYLLSALAWAGRGSPPKAWYLLVGDRDGGKSTLYRAAFAAVGDVSASGYGVSIAITSIMATRFVNPNQHTQGMVGMHQGRWGFLTGEPPRGEFNNELIKSLTGGDHVEIRGLNEKGAKRPVAATMFGALNMNRLPNIKLDHPAIAGRTKMLRYPKLPLSEDELDREYQNRVSNTRAARQAFFATLMSHLLKMDRAPQDIPIVAEFVREHTDSTIGLVGVWIRDHLVVTHSANDVVNTETLWTQLSAKFELSEDGRIEGKSRRATLAQVRDLVEGLPVASRALRGQTEWRGVRLLTDDEVMAETSATLPAVCAICKANGKLKVLTERDYAGREFANTCKECSDQKGGMGPGPDGTGTPAPVPGEMRLTIQQRLGEMEGERQRSVAEIRNTGDHEGLQLLTQAMFGLRSFMASNPDVILRPEHVAGSEANLVALVERIARMNGDLVSSDYDWTPLTLDLRRVAEQHLEESREPREAGFQEVVLRWFQPPLMAREGVHGATS